MEEMVPIIGISWQERISLAQDTCKHTLCGLAAPTPETGVQKFHPHLTEVCKPLGRYTHLLQLSFLYKPFQSLNCKIRTYMAIVHFMKYYLFQVSTVFNLQVNDIKCCPEGRTLTCD